MAESHPKLGYRKRLQCVGHEVAPGAQPEEAEMLVAGHSFCYPCGNAALGHLMEEGWTPAIILRMFRDGVIEVAPA